MRAGGEGGGVLQELAERFSAAWGVDRAVQGESCLLLERDNAGLKVHFPALQQPHGVDEGGLYTWR